MTEVSEAQEADAWNPVSTKLSRIGYAVYAVWTIAQPIVDGLLWREPRWLGRVQWLVGVLLGVSAVYVARYVRAAPYRSVVSAARLEHSDSLVYGIRLDPLTTPVGIEWGDSQVIRWGLLRALPNGIEIVRSDGAAMLDRRWDEVEFTVRGIDVVSGPSVEEWWFQFMSEAGIWPRPIFVRRGRSRFLRIQALRPTASDAAQCVL